MSTAVPFNPFPGLRPFETGEEYLFFGREGQSEKMLTRLQDNRLLAVVGTSGSGKSSLVRAGLLPYLYGGFMAGSGSHWRAAILRPGRDPIGNLARALNDVTVLGAPAQPGEDLAKNAVLLEITLRRSGLGLIDAVRLARLSEHENVVIIVDQFEELFRFADAVRAPRRGDDAAAFVKLLLEATRPSGLPIYVGLTMRSDFIGDCARFQELPEAVTEGLYLIPRMTREELRSAIEGPVRVADAEISQRLVTRLLNDTGNNADELPTLQHALMRTWDYWATHHADGQAIDLEHYTAIGGMSEALYRHAEEAYADLPTPHSREIARRLFQCLTERGPDNRELRRPTTVGNVAAVAGAEVSEVISVVELFRRPGRSFLMPAKDVPLNGESVIDISHESLIRGWERLRDWVEEESQSARIYRRLAETAALHSLGRAGLWHDPDLRYALRWQRNEKPNAEWAKRYHGQFEQAMAFLDDSRTARNVWRTVPAAGAVGAGAGLAYFLWLISHGSDVQGGLFEHIFFGLVFAIMGLLAFELLLLAGGAGGIAFRWFRSLSVHSRVVIRVLAGAAAAGLIFWSVLSLLDFIRVKGPLYHGVGGLVDQVRLIPTSPTTVSAGGKVNFDLTFVLSANQSMPAEWNYALRASDGTLSYMDYLSFTASPGTNTVHTTLTVGASQPPGSVLSLLGVVRINGTLYRGQTPVFVRVAGGSGFAGDSQVDQMRIVPTSSTQVPAGQKVFFDLTFVLAASGPVTAEDSVAVRFPDGRVTYLSWVSFSASPGLNTRSVWYSPGQVPPGTTLHIDWLIRVNGRVYQTQQGVPITVLPR